MIKIKDPPQMELFDRFAELPGPSACRRMENGWQGCSRERILYLLTGTVKKISDRLSLLTGPETKELFSMAELMVIKEFFKRTNEDAADRRFPKSGGIFQRFAFFVPPHPSYWQPAAVFKTSDLRLPSN